MYVDFDQGAGDLIENAKTVREVIKWVNAEKEANCSSSQNVIAGYSMGGVVGRGRYAGRRCFYWRFDRFHYAHFHDVSADTPIG